MGSSSSPIAMPPPPPPPKTRAPVLGAPDPQQGESAANIRKKTGKQQLIIPLTGGSLIGLGIPSNVE